MSLITVLILAIGLSMDAFAVSIAKGLALKKIGFKECLCAGLWFGVFQGLMPAIGYILGSMFAGYIEAFSAWIGFILLALIGSNMIREALKGGEENVNGSMKPSVMFVMAIATSIDALAIGLTFSMMPVTIVADWSRFANTMLACLLICLTTGILSMIGVKLGSIVGSKFGDKAQIAGGIILILIGLRLILGHYGLF